MPAILLVVEEAARLVRFFGGEPRIFDPSDLPLPDQVKPSVSIRFRTPFKAVTHFVLGGLP